MKKLRRIIPLLCAICVLLSSLTLTEAFAQETVRFEAEALTYKLTDSEGKTDAQSSWKVNSDLTGATSTSGKLTCFQAGGLGGRVEFKINVDKAGEYGVVYAYRSHNKVYSIVQVYVNGTAIGGEISQKSGDTVGDSLNKVNVCREVVLGNAQFKAGENTVAFEMTELNDSSRVANDSAITVDYIELTDPVNEKDLQFTERKNPPIPSEATLENTTPVNAVIPEGMLDTYEGKKETPKTTDKITVWDLPSCYNESSRYELKVDGVKVPVTDVRGQYEYAFFDYEASKGEVEIVITCKSKPSQVSVSPRHLEVKATKSDKTITAKIKLNYNYTFYIDGKVLNISANPMQTDVPGSSGTGIFNITEAPYSVNKNMTDAQMTSAIQQALDDASAYGSAKGNKNGVVYIPGGIYTVGNLNISSNTYVYLEGDAVLRISTDKSLLRVDGKKDSMKKPDGSSKLPFTRWISTTFKDMGNGKVLGSYDIRIGGRGTVDARDDYFYNTTSMGNNTVDPVACSYFRLEGLTVRESVCWSIIAARSDHLTFEWLRIYNRVEGNFEGDCIDICESQDAYISNCIGFARDDPFSTKCWDYRIDISETWPGYPEYLNNVTFDNCSSYTGCVGFKVGQGVEQSQYNVTFKNSTVLRATIGISVHHKFGTGVAKNITFENIYIENIFGSYDGHSSWLMLLVQNHSSRGNGPIQNVIISNIHIYAGAQGGNNGKLTEIKGVDLASRVEGVLLNNIYYNNKLVKDLKNILPDIETNQFVKDVRLKNGELSDILEEENKPAEPEKKPDPQPEEPEDPVEQNKKPGIGLWIGVGVGAAVLVGAAVAAVILIGKKKKK